MTKTIHPRIVERIGLDGVADAHRRIEAGRMTGKIVICP
jgi:NADPH:quinone reductase-like Zn-dependent oxidoreductase